MNPHEKTRRRQPWEREGHPFDDGYGYDDPGKIEAHMKRSFSHPGAPTVEVVELERRWHQALVAVDERELLTVGDAAELRRWEDHATRRLMFELRAAIYGKKHPDRHVIRFPADWWQALKERFAPAWFLDRYPVRFTEVTASLDETYPEVRPALPDERAVMKFHVRHLDSFPRW